MESGPQFINTMADVDNDIIDTNCHFDESSLFMDDEDQELEELNFTETDSRYRILYLSY